MTFLYEKSTFTMTDNARNMIIELKIISLFAMVQDELVDNEDDVLDLMWDIHVKCLGKISPPLCYDKFTELAKLWMDNETHKPFNC